MPITQIKLPTTSLAMAATMRRCRAGKPEPGKHYPTAFVEMGEFDGRGLAKADAAVAVGDTVFVESSIGQEPREALVVASIDRNIRAAVGEWLIEWAQVPSPRGGEPSPAVVLDPERFQHIMLAWAYEQTDGGKAQADLHDFAPGDVPLDCALSLADHLCSDGLLQYPPRSTTTVALTAQGVAAAEAAAAERSDRTLCAEALQTGLVKWLYKMEDVPGFLDLRDFMQDPFSTFRGRFFTEREIWTPFGDLVDLGLVKDNSPAYAYPELTARGRICARYHEGNVREYMNAQTPQNSPTIKISGSNNQTVIGDDARQTAYAPPPAHREPVAAAEPESAVRAEAAANAESAPPEPARHPKLSRFLTRTNIILTLVCAIIIAVYAVLAYYKP